MKRKPKSPKSHHAPARDRELIYGIHPVLAALRNSARCVQRVWVTQNIANRFDEDLKQIRDILEIVHSREIDRRAGSGAVHQGIVIEASPLPATGLDQLGTEGPLILLDQVTDPHNVGAILRTSAAFGVAALVMTARHSPDASAVLAKSASGALEHVPLIRVPNLARAIEHIKDLSFAVIGLDSQAPVTIERMSLPGPYALVLGAEGKGLRQLSRKNCDCMVRLDLPGTLVSLNVSNAAALALYALVRK